MLEEREAALLIQEKKVVELKSGIKVLNVALSRMDSTLEQTSNHNKPKLRGRKLDDKWQKVLQFIGSQDQISVNEIFKFIQAKGYNISKSNLPVQLISYLQKDWVRRVAPATYSLTESGIERCGCTKKTEPPIAATIEGSLTEQGNDQSDRITSLSDHSLGTSSKMRSYN